jgi:hypothetical protein
MRYIVNNKDGAFLTMKRWVCYMLASMVTRKRATSVRLSDEARSIMEQLAGTFGISQTAVLEQALRRWARAEGINIPNTPGSRPARRKPRDGKPTSG